jgi:sirohydrochlorin cobaltochelatase
MNATILFGHGSRDPIWRAPIDNVAQRMLEIDPQGMVRCAFLELTQPSLDVAATELIRLGVDTIRIVPMFLGVGRHAREDLPVLVDALRVQFPAVNFNLRPSVGEEARVIELLAAVAVS